jgi:hypothetical protein
MIGWDQPRIGFDQLRMVKIKGLSRRWDTILKIQSKIRIGQSEIYC